jgi:hypothetical protein
MKLATIKNNGVSNAIRLKLIPKERTHTKRRNTTIIIMQDQNMCITIIINLVHVYASAGQMMAGLSFIPNGACASTDTRPNVKGFSKGRK